MKANQFSHLCRFQGGLPSLVFRDHEGGRIQLWLAKRWIATVIPGHLLVQECEAVLLTRDQEWEEEWRGTYGEIAAGVSALQQTADWQEAADAFYAAKEFDELLGL